MTKKALLLLAEGFEDVEAVTAVDILRRAGVEVTTAGLVPGLVRGARGTTLQPDALLADVENLDFDALVLPGGAPGAENLAASPAVRALVLRHHAAGKVVAAICAAPALVLAPLGVLDGKSATCFPGMEDRFPKSATFKAAPVVADGNVLTSRALGTSLAWSLALAERLAGKEAADKIRRAVLA